MICYTNDFISCECKLSDLFTLSPWFPIRETRPLRGIVLEMARTAVSKINIENKQRILHC